MTKGADLQAKLAKSLDRANAKAIAAQPTKVSSAPTHSARGSQKLSISLYSTDTAKIRDIVLHMTQNDCPISASQAVRLALRSATIDQTLMNIYRAMQQEDGRRVPKTQNNTAH